MPAMCTHLTRQSLPACTLHVAAVSLNPIHELCCVCIIVVHHCRALFSCINVVHHSLLCLLCTAPGRAFEQSLDKQLAHLYRQLAVLRPDAPVPLSTLAVWWHCTMVEAADAARLLEKQGVMKVAPTPDKDAWCMISPDHLEYLKVSGVGV